MKIFVSADMEGVAGVVHGGSTMQPHPDYHRYQKFMTNEVNAAIEGAFESRAQEVLINDGHGSMRNILIEDLHINARLITGYPKPLLQMTGIDESFDAAIFIGYHAKNNTQGVLSHTYFSAIGQLKLNDHVMSEAEFNATIAGHFDVPVILISGDNILHRQIKKLLPNTKFVETKEAITRVCANSITPQKSCELIKATVKTAIEERDDISPVKLKPPYVLEIQCSNSTFVAIAEQFPNTQKVDELVIRYEADNLLQIQNFVTTYYNAASVTAIEPYK